MKILTVIGARPQFIKASAVSRAIQQVGGLEEVIVHTGQHFDEKMSQIFFDELSIPVPKYNLDIHGLNHGAMTGKMLAGIEEIILLEKPDYLLVYGDTNSTLAGALAASKLHVKVIHVEAGLRSFNMKMPEEINRILTDRVSHLLFCPTETAMNNLEKEGFDQMKLIYLNSGDVMYDTTLHYSQLVKWDSPVLENFKNESFVLCTLHRAENTDNLERLRNIIEGLNKISQSIKVLVPLHPRTKNIIEKLQVPVHFEIIEPVGYLDMLGLIQSCALVMTDSGGLQKEAFFLKKYCITMRDETEWVELVENGYNFLVGADQDKMVEKFLALSQKEINDGLNLYGEGTAADYIVKQIKATIDEGPGFK
ncbi:UDP-N-acetylglucosamine 2-epimerase (non-hydrolyzing) [Litoribacter ruber]|uniref:non-hydrolyzing UDP-N-acetylglucosamine 2-epimerase n=1 Tax=Litoribacter ruber TaxID=702568 RepID=UPI001BDA2BBE|nr:UDP-N-acetylglucosamine 2-epimerase (non-hydrolyzing) [Litoribacter ruber]MBT0812855.1 UDP-N-acetylglucosamine 2-epimerase (non-hydrolyzing) [Litoribacter ruber]